MIYADFNGTSPLLDEVTDYLNDRLRKGPFGNPNAIHSLGQKVHKAMETCREICASSLGAQPEQVIFNSGSSEAISHIFASLTRNAKKNGKNIIITSPIEHSAVEQACIHYSKEGFEIQLIPVNSDGVVEVEAFKKAIDENQKSIAFVTIMAANNETGVIQPYEEIAEICQNNKIPFFSDTTQFIGKKEFHFQKNSIPFACLSGHKIGALTGTGILLTKDPSLLSPYIFGGGQEKGLRGGTQNYIGNETLAIALECLPRKLEQLQNVQKQRVDFEKKILESFPEAKIMGHRAKRLPSTTMIAYKGLHGQGIQIELESHNIFCTTSSACSDNEPQSSKVLKAMGVDDALGRGAVRISVGGCPRPGQTYERIYDILSQTYKKLVKIKSF